MTVCLLSASWFCLGAFGYAVGSIPFGVLFARLFHLGDLRAIGSGNIGATNVMRTGHGGAALLTLLCDALKGFLPVLIAVRLSEGLTDLGMSSPWGAYSVALACILGHIFPLWGHFHGGKGLATTAGTLLALDPQILLVGLACWLTIFAITRISSLSALASLTGVVLGKGYQIWKGTASLSSMLFMVVLAALLIWTHRSNIKRLLAGTEKALGKAK